MIYITSDFHFGHDKDFIYQPRGFSSVDEMNKAIFDNYIATIKPDDDIYILGDVLVGNALTLNEGIDLLNQLPGHIHLVRGNHDSNVRWSAYQERCTWDLVEASNSTYIHYKKYHFYLTHYPTITSNNDYDKPLKQRLLNICGHSHSLDKWADADKGYIYHVEVDAHDCYPVLLDDIIEDFKQAHEKTQNLITQIDTEISAFTETHCDKCVWQGICPGFNYYKYPIPSHYKWTYKRDPPDGGYYG